jgi:hypothetical protein
MVLTLAAVTLILAALATADIATRRDQDKPAANNKPQPTAMPDKKSDNETQELTVTLKSEKESYRIGEKVLFGSTVLNNTSAPLTFTFNDTCTQGKLFIDDIETQRSRLCGQAITDVVLPPGQPKSYRYSFDLVAALADVTPEKLPAGTIDYDKWLALTPGEHRAHLDWRGFKSEPVSFTVTP